MVSIFYQNVNGIRSKLTQFNLNLLNSNYDIICLTETNLNNSVFDSEVVDTRYNIFRRDRMDTCSQKREGGGVLLAVLKKFEVARQASWDSSLEDIWLTIIPESRDSPRLNICVCYLPPDISCDKLEEFYAHCQKLILNDFPDDKFLLVGDFNTPDYHTVSLNSLNISTNVSNPSRKCTLINELIALCNLTQCNHVTNTNGRLLDLVLSGFDGVTVGESFCLSRLDKHHPAIVIEIPVFKVSKYLKRCNAKILNFSKCDVERTRSELGSINWHEVLACSNVDICVDIFYNKLFDIINRHTPLTSLRHSLYPIWYSKPLIKCNEEKNKFHKLYKIYGNPRDYDTFSLLRNRCKDLAAKCYNKYISSTEDALAKDIKSFWRFVNNRRGNVSIPSTMTFGNTSSSDGFEVCELFARYFGSVFEKSDYDENLSVSVDDHISSSLSQVVLSEKDIQLKIKQLDKNKGPGPDQLPASFVKSCGRELAAPLCIIFNKSLSCGVFPKRWKTAHIIPIYKSGDKSRCENYRPISILSCFAKLFESLVYNHLYNHVKPLLSDRQHGFVKNRSTVSNLLEYKNYLCHAFAKCGQVDSIYTDFSKAFDKVNHKLLCHKLALYGVHGSLYRWVCSYLNNRSQLVALKGFVSSPVTVSSGVPQGSHLGPLLFVIFINDLIPRLTSNCLLYADDLKIFNVISTDDDCVTLQNDLNTVSQWCRSNLMYLNIDKCFIISFTNKRHKIVNNYNIDGHVLHRSYVAKDLGILFDDKLTFRAHYQYIISKANQLLGFVLRSTKGFKKPRSILHLFNALVRSNLENGSPIWSPNYKVHSLNIERIQRKCLKLIIYRIQPGRSSLSYEERLSRFHVQSLEVRRIYFDLIYLYKIIHFIIDSPMLLSVISFNIRFRARNCNRTNLFALRTYKNNISYYNPLTRMARQYNDLAKTNLELDIFDPKLSHFVKTLRNILYKP